MPMNNFALGRAHRFSRYAMLILLISVVLAVDSFSFEAWWPPFVVVLLLPLVFMNAAARAFEDRLMVKPARMFRSYLGMPMVAIVIGISAHKNQSLHEQFYQTAWWFIASIVLTVLVGVWFRNNQSPTRTPYDVRQYWSPTKVVNDYLVVPLLVFMLLYRGPAIFYGGWASTIACFILLGSWLKLARYDASHFKRLAHPWYDWNRMIPFYKDEFGRRIRI
jgi:hypothetical protein